MDGNRASAATARRVGWLRSFRGYSEDEARLAAWAADIVEAAEAHLKHTEQFCRDRHGDDVTCSTWAELRKALNANP